MVGTVGVVGMAGDDGPETSPPGAKAIVQAVVVVGGHVARAAPYLFSAAA